MVTLSSNERVRNLLVVYPPSNAADVESETVRNLSSWRVAPFSV